jgi:hypothetical protein
MSHICMHSYVKLTGPNRLPRFVFHIPCLYLDYLLLGRFDIAILGYGDNVTCETLVMLLLLLVYLICMIRLFYLIGTW